jgi:hypothetical protein
MCSDLDVSYPQQFVTIWTNQYLVPLLRNNQHYSERVSEVFAKEEGFFGYLEGFLFKPRHQFFKEAKKFVGQNLEGKMPLGLQLHVGETGFDGQFEDPLESDKELRKFFRCVESLEKEEEHVWFLATDSSGIKEYATKHYSKNIVFFEQNVTGVTLPSPADWRATILENWILSQCADTVMRSASSYGALASKFQLTDQTNLTQGGRTPGRKPYFVTESSCFKRASAEPCLPYWHLTKELQCASSGNFEAEEFLQGTCIQLK